jgi:potassium/chloride transporter 9
MKKDSVDMEQLVRMEIYPRGFCPHCRKYFGNHPLPVECPYLDCRRDLKVCLQYPNRREATKAPPRLAQRAFLDTRPRGNLKGNGLQPRVAVRGGNNGQGRQAIPSLSVEAPTPTDEQKPLTHRAPPPPQQQRKSPSPSNTIRTIWPSPLGIYYPTQANQPPTPERLRYMEKPLPPPPTPPAPSPPTRSERRPPPPPPPPPRFPPTTLTESIAERHRRLYQQHHPQQQHIPSQLRTSQTPTSPLSLTPILSPSPSPSPSPPPSPPGLT